MGIKRRKIHRKPKERKKNPEPQNRKDNPTRHDKTIQDKPNKEGSKTKQKTAREKKLQIAVMIVKFFHMLNSWHDLLC